ncbi:2Fe-2S iron-sulfur cluster binding domain-containing protein [Persicimonas caeni]|uniref:2Fe-2S iron-sulfur cluster binding domain-containing protein n=1 Tax=Persicimonas caeni TaxID=2292766 RepID=A0A4Y6PYA1_PERCE|nr:2Fe-2S iron-sulfur cluster binding domain-containing protein [Persicimonas caeni]QDG53296.1 2Fe-2S iron-sulfur cluster binding domain-containing protein [Persicimonas caeni]QED34518.1 2Fe-2S iron-sulfur cluster binding domain-containing protein [Persicimonas caeni]
MGLTQLLPRGVQRRLRRLRQDAADVTTALTTRRRPVAREGALTDPNVYAKVGGPTPFEAPCPAEPGELTPPTTTTEGVVIFADHGAEIAVEPGQTILDAGLEAGLDLDFSCTLGGCAACALQLVEGEVLYDGPNCLSDAERQSGMCLACVGRPNGKIIVASL